MSDAHVQAVQRWYPQIYLTCHTRHQRAASTGVGLSAHDSSVLAHLDETEPVSASQLARHLSIGAPTLSATLNRLVKLGYVVRVRAAEDRRVMDLRLSKAGARAMQASSVLDSSRVAVVLAELTTAERRLALDGLSLLARAARAVANRTVANRTTAGRAAADRAVAADTAKARAVSDRAKPESPAAPTASVRRRAARPAVRSSR